MSADPEGCRLAVIAEALYLANLLALPGLAFLVLAWLWYRERHTAPLLGRLHLEQTFTVSLWGGILIVVCSATILVFGGLDQRWTWVAVILYFTCVHSTLVLLGVVGLAKAMACKPWAYPLIGPKPL
jgi:O-antigen ligase